MSEQNWPSQSPEEEGTLKSLVDIDQMLHVEGLPDEIANRWMYVYRGYMGKVATDGFPGVEEGSSYWAPTVHVPFAAMGGPWKAKRGLFRAKMRVGELFKRIGDSIEVCDFDITHFDYLDGLLKDIEEITGEEFESIAQQWTPYQSGNRGKALIEGNQPIDKEQFKQWLLANQENPLVFVK